MVADIRLEILEDGKSGKVAGRYWVNGEKSDLPSYPPEEALARIAPSIGMTTGILPPVVRYVSPTGKGVLLERPPQVKSIVYRGTPKGHVDEATRVQEYDIPLPWTVYAISLSDAYHPTEVYVFGTAGPIENETTPLYLLPLTNCDREGRLCPPSHTWSGDEDVTWTVSQGVNAAYNEVWSSNFNTDITETTEQAYRHRLPREIFDGKKPIAKGTRISAANIYQRWSLYTTDDVVKWKWIPIPNWRGDAAPGNTINVGVALSYLRNLDSQRYHENYLFNTIRQRLL